MKRTLLTACLCTLALFASSQICPPNQANQPVPPADDCVNAPPFCSSFLQGFCSTSAGATPDTPGNLDAVFSCNIQNNQWLRFTACHDTARFSLLVDDCSSGEGLQFAVFQSFDCLNFAVFADCFTLAEGNAGMLIATGLTVGESYLLMVDGAGGDLCSWRILSVEGVSNGITVQENNTPGHITNLDGSTPPTSACLTQPVVLTLTFEPPVCALLPVNDPNGCSTAVQQICQNPQPPGTCQVDTVWHVEPPGAIFQNGDSTGAQVTIIFPDTLDVPPGGFLEFTISVDFVAVQPGGQPCFENCLSECFHVLPDSDPCMVLPHKIKLCKPDFEEKFFVTCPQNLPVIYQGQAYSCGDYNVTKIDPCGCEDVTLLHVFCQFEQPPTASQPVFQCDASGDFYTVSYTFNPPFYTYFVNGSLVNGGSYTSPPIPSGQSYSLLVTPVGSCQLPSFTLSGSYACPCQSEAFDLGVVELCPGECFDLQGNSYCTAGSYSEQFTDAGGCMDTYLFSIQTQNVPPLSVGVVDESCDATNLNYLVTFTISAGTPPYFVNGSPSGSAYVSSPIPSGQPYIFLVTDSGVCGGSSAVVQGSYECSAITNAGTMSQAAMQLCEGQMAVANWNNDAVLDGNDALVFMLHTNPGAPLGDVLGVNTTGAFGFLSGQMNFGQTYFISAVAGNELNGNVDLADPNLSVAQGQPVTFFSTPTLDLLPPAALTCALPEGMLSALTSGGSGDFNFNWTGANSFFSSQQNPVVDAGGSYNCVLTDNLTGCTAAASVQVSEDKNPPDLAVAGCELDCAQPACDLLAQSDAAGVFFNWTLPGGEQLSGESISTNLLGTYFVVATDGQNGCTAQAQTEVQADTSLTEVVLPGLILPFPPAALDFCGTPVTVWADTQLVCVVGCERQVQNVVFQLASPLLVSDVQLKCDPTSSFYQVCFTISGGTPSYFVNGTPSDNTFISNPIPSGSPYYFEVTDAGVGSEQVILDGWMVCDPYTFCGTMSTSALSACGGDVVVTAWNNNALLDANDVVVFVLHTGSGNFLDDVLGVNSTGVFSFDPGTMSYGQTYFVSAVAGNAAPGGGVDFNDPYLSVSQGQPVTFYPIPSLDLLPPDTLTCVQTSVMLTALTDLPGSMFSWSAPGFFSTEQNPVTAAAGTYACTVTDPSGSCSATADLPVFIDTLAPDVMLDGCEITCQSAVCQLIPWCGTPFVNYEWTLPNGDTLSGDSISSNLPGTYSVKVTGPNGCFSIAICGVTDASVPPDIFVSGGDIICGTPASLTATSNSPGVVFTWILPDGTTAAGSGIAAAEPGIYFATATEPAGCTNEAEAQVGQTDSAIEPFFEVKSPTCFGWEDGYIRLDSIAGGTPPYLFSPGFPPDFPLENIGVGEYPLNITDANGCTFDTTFLLQNPPPVTVELGEDKTILPGESVELKFESNIVPAEIHWWESGGQTFENELVWLVQPVASSLFFVQVADAKHCAVIDSVSIFLEASEEVFVPNVFSPNGDGQNDRLTIFASEDVVQVRSFRIFDRWGELTFLAENFTPNDLAHGWDGKAKGKALDPAVFIFLAEIEMKNGEVMKVAGEVTLLR